MTFRPLISDVRRAGPIGLVCLAFVCISRPGDAQEQPIDVVAAHNTQINTNVNELPPEPAGNLDKALHGSAHFFNPPEDSDQQMPAPYRPQARPLTEREQQWLDRRRDWVFMTPEELISEDAHHLLGIKDDDKNGIEKKDAGTPLERYYQHLIDAQHDAQHSETTNKLDKSRDWAADPSDNDTNSLAGGNQNDGDYFGHAPDGPFNSRPDQGVFQSTRPNSVSGLFDLKKDPGTPSDEEVRVRQEQQAHMDAFKPIWDIDQPVPSPVALTTVSSSLPAASIPFGSVQPVLGAAAPSLGTSPSQQSSGPPPPQPALNSERQINRLLTPSPVFSNPHSQAP